MLPVRCTEATAEDSQHEYARHIPASQAQPTVTRQQHTSTHQNSNGPPLPAPAGRLNASAILVHSERPSGLVTAEGDSRTELTVREGRETCTDKA